MSDPDIKMGIYRHYKGPLYQVFGLAHDANVDTLRVEGGPCACARTSSPFPGKERIVVVYMPLQLDGAHLGPRMAVRTLEDWDALVCGEASCRYFGQSPHQECRDKRTDVERFTYLGPVLTAEMLPEASGA